ncbi:MAG: MoaD/ThiS family protein [Haliscomenobacter sp.]|nr:MoaD/ThiS family protein [Haliscomenobacter sp.]MBK7477160.1 MoaD/ThiS family protein [Haliscomenobacter sp.]MBK8878657.1 MoaD/ThiS family protein [Haliscomenobacter sp.]
MKTTFQILAFGMARDILGRSVMELEWNSPISVGELREELIRQYPELARLKTLAVAVNSEYAQDGNLLKEGDEVALIPPVSGG